jgi:hypothetical protein
MHAATPIGSRSTSELPTDSSLQHRQRGVGVRLLGHAARGADLGDRRLDEQFAQAAELGEPPRQHRDPFGEPGADPRPRRGDGGVHRGVHLDRPRLGRGTHELLGRRILTADGHRIAGLPLGHRRAHALLQALLVFRLLPNGFRNRDVRDLLAGLLGKDTDQISPGQVSYDLRRLRAHGLIERIPGSHRYQTSDRGLHHAMLLTHINTLLLQPGLAQLTDPGPPAPTPLRSAARNYQRALDDSAKEAGFAA